jgi:PAS domain S-box-containing protein
MAAASNSDESERWASQSEGLYRRALDASAIFAVTDSRGRIEYVNDQFCRISGYSEEELLGQDHRLLNSGYHGKEFFSAMYREIASGKTWRGEIRNRAKDGTLYWVDTTIVPMLGANGKPDQYVAIRQDITERKRIESQLIDAVHEVELASRAKDLFLANMSHEIRTPMTAILGFIELLAEESPDADRGELVGIIRNNGERLLALINDILDISKIEANCLALELSTICPAELVNQVYTLLRPKAEAKGIELVMEIHGAVPRMVRTDVLRCIQILTNLTGNAIKFTEQGQVRILISCTVTDSGRHMLQIGVQDTGIGISEEQINRLFAPFTQADASTTRRFGGTGLGLCISLRLAQKLGGTIHVESEPGRGSLFTVVLDTGIPTEEIEFVDGQALLDQLRLTSEQRSGVHDGSSVQVHAVGNQHESERTGRLWGVRVLVVDDTIDNQRLINLHLRRAGATVSLASNGLEAVQKCLDQQSGPYDLVLMDIQMPELDGLSATQRLRSLGYTQPVIALTANAMLGDKDKCIAAGCDGYLTKPIDAAKLIEACWSFVQTDSVKLRHSA